jgi:WD40 repeat protein
VKSKIVGHSDFVRALATAGERLITASDDKTIRVWDLEFHDCAKVLKGHSSYVNALVCARARLFSASMDRTIKIWE